MSFDLMVIGAGPAGLSAAAEAASHGLKVAVFDENALPGGQLFKQIHKFFGSKEHKAKMRGIDIGIELLEETDSLGVKVFLNSPVVGLYKNREIVVRQKETVRHFKADSIIVATGASENLLPFDGWTLPGVMGAGAAQTMMNINRVKPGNRVLMLGSGNVGLVVGFQLLQAGCELVAIADAAPRIGGYGVHASKLTRTGVPFYLSHTIMRAEGRENVTGVVIGQVDENWQHIPDTEKHFEVDTICLAVGLSPSAQLLKMAGCKMSQNGTPVCDKSGETSLYNIFAAGDVSGIEEASSAMIEGRISAAAAAKKLGFISEKSFQKRSGELDAALSELRQGMFAPQNRNAPLEKTDEGFNISKSLLKKGYITEEEISEYPGFKPGAGIRPVIECTQNIPCDPCRDICPKGCIKVENIVSLPVYDENTNCTGCGLCVAACPGQAIFLTDDRPGKVEEGKVAITIPYEFLPLPEKVGPGMAYDRSGAPLCPAYVSKIQESAFLGKTPLVTFVVPKNMAMRARFWKAV
ncbi:MAG: FAD-dependent oxidoreductase [Defluviitaleaceae bacterium]|nr:FAD-dependent oxidoreductase [Defluviitaleaceae bacterium]